MVVQVRLAFAWPLNLIRPRKGTETYLFHNLHNYNYQLNLIRPRKGTETVNIFSRFKLETLIEPYKTPKGDGNFSFFLSLYIRGGLNLIRPRKGTETHVENNVIFIVGIIRLNLIRPRKGTEIFICVLVQSTLQN